MKRMRLMGCVKLMAAKEVRTGFWLGRPKERDLLEVLGWKDNIKIGRDEMWWEDTGL